MEADVSTTPRAGDDDPVNPLAQAMLLVSFPVVASVVGALLAVTRPPGPRFVSGVQHFAAGVVMAALVGEVMPELREMGNLVWTVAGFVGGAALVLIMGAWGRRVEGRRTAGHSISAAAGAALPIGMLSAIAVDLLVDGVLIGLGSRLGFWQGVILAIALTLELLFLGLSVVAELRETGVSPRGSVLICFSLGLVTAVGAGLAVLLLGGVGTAAMAAVLAFGAAALLYLVVEELLVEAHEERETVTLGAMFFLGFLVIYVLSALET